MLEIKNISKAYNRQGKNFFAVKDVNLNILTYNKNCLIAISVS